jgi:hypothetical protein
VRFDGRRSREGHRRKRRCGELRRVESDEQFWGDLLAQRGDLLGHQTGGERFSVHELERPGADTDHGGRGEVAASLDEAEQPDVGEGAHDVGEDLDHGGVTVVKRA